MMREFYRTPEVEDGRHNIILQNRAGNRLTLLFYDDHTALEFLYKPNAFRRKDFRARNFSNRDNCTMLFPSFDWPEITAGMVKQWGYDPFVTRLETLAGSKAVNTLTVVNLPDENAFVLAARQPLLLAFRPHRLFEVEDGLLREGFTDRGEDIVSFVAFDSMEQNRYRVLDDGRHVLQLMEDDVVLIGGEENRAQVQRVLRKFSGWTLPRFVAHTERLLKPVLGHGQIRLHDDPELQRVLDINRRLLWSAVDAGGVSFGAMTRIYHLIWIRDMGMATSALARSGWCDPIRLWTPFLLAHPSVTRDAEGNAHREFSQLLGTRWSKSEDDGIYFALLSLFYLVQTTGHDRLLENGALPELLAILDHTIATRFKADLGLFGSDVIGEDALAGSPYYGYDVVSGKLVASRHADQHAAVELAYACSLYQNMNMYNALRIAQLLIEESGDPALGERSRLYAALAARLESALRDKFVNEKGCYRSVYTVHTDGTSAWHDFAPLNDFWEYAWAVSACPFVPDPAISLASARMITEVWPTVASYGYCPWNFLLRTLKEYGLSSDEYRGLLDQQVKEALLLTRRFPMAGLVTEYQGAVEGWRGLPFQIGSLNLSVCSQLLQPLARGLALRAGDLVDEVANFHVGDSRLHLTATGKGDVVAKAVIHGRELGATLQIPEDQLRRGPNRIEVLRGSSFQGLRLYASDARLRHCDAGERHYQYELHSPFAAQLLFEGWQDAVRVTAKNAQGQELPFRVEAVHGTSLTLLRVESNGEFTVGLDIRGS